jgi:sugar phosphate isomerase/epimerase
VRRNPSQNAGAVLDFCATVFEMDPDEVIVLLGALA